MGCDIHMYVERRHDGKWYNCDYFVPSIEWRDADGPDDSKYTRVPIYDHRNYSLFATLADVRNYGNTDYICEPKGLPEDASQYVASEYDDWRWDAHSCSYLTLKELIDFQREKHPLKRRGMISPEAQKQFDESGILPDTWCQGTSNPGYAFREWEEDIDILEPLIDALRKRADELYIIYDFAWDSANETLRNSAYEAAADMRIVFWFDN
jgi:hypothetical protein